jgi:hypothetical protein
MASLACETNLARKPDVAIRMKTDILNEFLESLGSKRENLSGKVFDLSIIFSDGKWIHITRFNRSISSILASRSSAARDDPESKLSAEPTANWEWNVGQALKQRGFASRLLSDNN